MQLLTNAQTRNHWPPLVICTIWLFSNITNKCRMLAFRVHLNVDLTPHTLQSRCSSAPCTVHTQRLWNIWSNLKYTKLIYNLQHHFGVVFAQIGWSKHSGIFAPLVLSHTTTTKNASPCGKSFYCTQNEPEWRSIMAIKSVCNYKYYSGFSFGILLEESGGKKKGDVEAPTRAPRNYCTVLHSVNSAST